MGAKDKAAKSAQKKLRVAAKAEKKTTQKDKKASAKRKPPSSKENDNDNDNDPDDADASTDLDAVLATLAAHQAAHTLVTTTACAPPSPRSSATLLASPANPRELLLFGGEYFDGQLARFHADLFVYHTRRDAWSVVKSGNAPLPRSGHAWTRGGEGEAARGVWLFGGEFSSPRQGVFYHYSDFWRLDEAPKQREWCRVEPAPLHLNSKGKGGGGVPTSPSARSGHRMTHFKWYVVLFGGFQDTSSSTKYLNDLWLFDARQGVWHCPVLPAASARPEARSSCSLLEWEGGAVLCGGYSRVKQNVGGGGQKGVGRKGKGGGGGGGGGKQDVLKPVVHTDAWFLRITPPSTTPSDTDTQRDPLTAPPSIRWERRKRPTNPPLPPRAGATMVSHRGRGVCFGGVHDVEADEEGIESEFFNGVDVWNVERNRWFGLGLKRPRGGGAGAAGGGGEFDGRDGGGGGRRGGKGRAKEGEDELVARLKALEAKDVPAAGYGAASSDAETDSNAESSDDGADGAHENEVRPKLVQYEYPHPRFRAQLAVQEDVLYIFGGTYEKGDREYTFDEMWAVDLGKLDGCKEIYRREVPEWVGSEDEESSDEDEDGEDGEDEDDEEQVEEEAEQHEEEKSKREENDQSNGTKGEKRRRRQTATKPDASSGSRTKITADDDRPDLDQGEPATTASDTPTTEECHKDDNTPYPRPFESLRTFYARTSIAWQDVLLITRASDIQDKSTKATKKAAFALAEQRWWDVREEVVAEEERMEESGIGEVVDVVGGGKDGKGGSSAGGAGIGKRR